MKGRKWKAGKYRVRTRTELTRPFDNKNERKEKRKFKVITYAKSTRRKLKKKGRVTGYVFVNK